MKSTLQVYINAKYPKDSLETLAWLESNCMHLGDFWSLIAGYSLMVCCFLLIERIQKLHEIDCALVWHIGERDYHNRKIKHYEQVICDFEKGRAIMTQDESVEGVGILDLLY